jgi:hypothetical protein
MAREEGLKTSSSVSRAPGTGDESLQVSKALGTRSMFEKIESAKIDELTDDELDLVSGGATGGISITHGGGNCNVAKGPLSESDQ